MIVNVNNQVDKVLTLSFVYDEANKHLNNTKKLLIGGAYSISYKETTKDGTNIMVVNGRLTSISVDDAQTREYHSPFQKPIKDDIVTVAIDGSTAFNSKIIYIKTYDITSVTCLDPVVFTPELIDALVKTVVSCEYSDVTKKTGIKFKDSDTIYWIPTTLATMGA